MTENVKPRIVAAIPCFNTERHIAEVVIGARKYVDQVIVINDGSHDQTTREARDAGATVISHDVNRGKGAAMKFAVQQAQADIIVFMDGDGQHNPDEIPLLLHPILAGQAEIVLGSRFLPGSKTVSNPFGRNLANLIASILISLIVSSPLVRKRKVVSNTVRSIERTAYRQIHGRMKWFTDCTSGFRAVKKDAWQKLTLISDGYQIETEIIYEAVRNGLSVAEVPISCVWHGSLSKLSIIKDGARTLGLVVKRAASDFRRKT